MDYENVLRTGHTTFGGGRPLRECTIDPFRYASQVARILNRGLEPGDSEYVEISRVEVYRGWPDARANPTGHRLNTLQRTAWLKGHHGVVDVTLRPLQRSHVGEGWNEKGVDVLCALALVRAARSPLYDVVALASRDSDLAPAVEEALRDHSEGTRVEVIKWFDPQVPSTKGSLRTQPRVNPIQLWASEYEASLDPTVHESRRQRRARERRA